MRSLDYFLLLRGLMFLEAILVFVIRISPTSNQQRATNDIRTNSRRSSSTVRAPLWVLAFLYPLKSP